MFHKNLGLTDFDLFFAVISTVLRMETHSYRCKKAKADANVTPVNIVVLLYLREEV